MSDPLTRILLIVWKLLVGQMELSQPQPSGIYPPPQDKPRRFFEERADMNHHYHCDTTLLAAGGYGGRRIYQDILKTKVQAKAVNIVKPSTSTRSSNPMIDSRV